MQKPVALYLDKGQLAALGLFAAHWTYFETEMDFTITAMTYHVAGNQEMPFPFADRMEHWQKMIQKYPLTPRGRRLYKSIVAIALKAQDRRSKFLHGRAIGDPTRRTKRICFEHHRHRKGKWSVQPITVEPRKIRAMARIAGAATTALISLNRRYLKVWPQSLPNTYPARPRDGKQQVHRGHIRSSKPQNRRQPSQA